MFNLALQDLVRNRKIKKDDFSPIINEVMHPKEYTKVALDGTGEVVYLMNS